MERHADQGPWAGRLMALLVLGLIIAVPAAWVGGYLGVHLGDALSYSALDGWCDVHNARLGVHCFGDYRAPVQAVLTSGDPWSGDLGIPIPYAGTGMVPYAIAAGLQRTFLGGTGALVIYMVGMVACMLVPAVYIAARRRGWPARGVAFLVLGAAATPLLIVFDRGGDVGFAVPFLLLFALWLDRDPSWVAPSAVIVAAAIRPQFILLALAFVAIRRWRALGATLITSAVLLVAGFIPWRGSVLDDMRLWFRMLVNPPLYIGDPAGQAVGTNPPNLSATRTVAEVLHAVGAGDGPMGWLRGHAIVPGAVVALAMFVVFAIRGRAIPRAVVVALALAVPAVVPGLSFTYYLVFVPVLAAVIVAQPSFPWLGRPGTGEGLFDEGLPPGRGWSAWAGFLIATIAVSMAPIVLPRLGDGYAWTVSIAGALWLVCIVWGLVIALWPRHPAGHPSPPRPSPAA